MNDRQRDPLRDELVTTVVTYPLPEGLDADLYNTVNACQSEGGYVSDIQYQTVATPTQVMYSALVCCRYPPRPFWRRWRRRTSDE